MKLAGTGAAVREVPRLSKSRFVAGVQCLKRLYWQVYEPDSSASPAPSARARMEQGIAVGIEARKAFPGGALVSADHEHIVDALAQTAELIGNRSVPAIFEAALEYRGVLVRVDILERLPRNRWRLIEVKSSTGVKEHHLHDVAIQHHVATRCGLRVSAPCLMHLNRQYVYDGVQYDPQKLFVIDNLKPQVRKIEDELTTLLARQRRALRGDEPPQVEAGAQCEDPIECEFYDRCHQPLPEFHISELPRLSARKLEMLQEQEIVTIDQIPESFPLTAVQHRVRDCVRSGQPWYGSHLKKSLAGLRFPLHFMDFETFYPALPRHQGMHPYDQIPFQWSVHTVASAHSEVEHREFLAEGTADPRREFITTLLGAVRDTGTVIVYNQQFESERLKDLAGWLPEFSMQISRLQKRLWDLLPVVRGNLYHPAFQGSFSIKNVLPALVPEMTYEGMEVSNGEEAGLAWDAMVNGQFRGREKQKVRDALLAYCRQDTLGMVRLWQFLETSRRRISE